MAHSHTQKPGKAQAKRTVLENYGQFRQWLDNCSPLHKMVYLLRGEPCLASHKSSSTIKAFSYYEQQAKNQGWHGPIVQL